VCSRLERKEAALVRIPVVVTQKINFADPFLSLSLSRMNSCSPLTLGIPLPAKKEKGFLQSNDK